MKKLFGEENKIEENDDCIFIGKGMGMGRVIYQKAVLDEASNKKIVMLDPKGDPIR